PSANELVAAVGGSSWAFEPARKLSSLCDFFADEHHLVVVARPDVDQTTADLALAWGLAYRGDRQLSVVLPAHRATPTLVRVPWLLPPVRVYPHVYGVVSETVSLTGAQSIAAVRDHMWDVSKVAALGDKADWVQPIL